MARRVVLAGLMATLAAPAWAGQATGRLRVGITIAPPSGQVTFQGRVLPDGAMAALHPRCRVAGGLLRVRGMAFNLDTNRPAAGARVVVRNGGRWLVGVTDGEGNYSITAPRTDAMTVTVVQVARPGTDGLDAIHAPMGRAACTEE